MRIPVRHVLAVGLLAALTHVACGGGGSGRETPGPDGGVVQPGNDGAATGDGGSAVTDGGAVVPPPPPNNRQTYSFNYGWKFIKMDVAGASAPAFDDSQWTDVSLPHTFNDVDTWVDWVAFATDTPVAPT